MSFSSSDSLGRNRSIVWMTRTCILALAAALCVVRLFVVRLEDRGSSKSEANTNIDGDAALFAASERLEQQVAVAIARARESVVALEYTAPDGPPGTRRVATGVVINHRGEVLSVRIDPPPVSQTPTAARNSSLIVALDFSGRRHSVHWVATDPETGLTLLRLPPRTVRPIRSAAGTPNLGSQVFVVGNPFGMGHSVSRGHVAGLDRVLELGPRQLGGLIQVQAPLYPGDSGAAVVNLHGDWLGLIRSGLAIPGSGPEPDPSAPLPSMISASSLTPSLVQADASLAHPEHDTDFGFAIPVGDAVWVANQLRRGGRVDRAYLGVRLDPFPPTGVPALSKSEQRLEPTSLLATPEMASKPPESAFTDPERTPGIADEGAILREVLNGTPASQAGLQAGDSIVEIDGQAIRSVHDLIDRLDRIPARATIVLGVVRDRGQRRQRISLSLRAASRPVVRQPVEAALPALTPTTAFAGGSANPTGLLAGTEQHHDVAASEYGDPHTRPGPVVASPSAERASSHPAPGRRRASRKAGAPTREARVSLRWRHRTGHPP